MDKGWALKWATGSYRRLIALYTITPISTVITFALLAVFPLVAYPLHPPSSHSPYPYAPYLPFPFPELLTSAALWSLSMLIRDFISSASSSLSTLLPPWGSAIVIISSTAIQTLVNVLLQLAAVALLLISPTPGIKHPTWHDHAFRRIWTVALGWAGIEAIVAIKQGYENIALYRDVLVSVKRISPRGSPDFNSRSTLDLRPSLTRRTSFGSHELMSSSEDVHRLTATGERQPLLPTKQTFSQQALEQEVENDLEQLVALKQREELEEIYGIPIIVS